MITKIPASVEDLVQNSFSSAAFPDGGFALVEEAMVGWRRFYRQPEEVKKLWTVGDQADPDDGWVARDGKPRLSGVGKFYDPNKEFFHANRRLRSLLAQAGTPIEPWAEEWLDVCDKLRAICLSTELQIANQMDQELYRRLGQRFNFTDLMRSEAALDSNVLRFLHYKPIKIDRPDGEKVIVAKFHPDRNFITLQLWQDVLGLLFRQGAGEDLLYQSIPGKVGVFLSTHAEEVTSGHLRRLWHGIEAEVVGGQTTERDSLVYFGKIG